MNSVHPFFMKFCEWERINVLIFMYLSFLRSVEKMKKIDAKKRMSYRNPILFL